MPPTQTGQGLDAVTAFASSGTQPGTSLGQQALAAGTITYGAGFAITMVTTAVLVVVVDACGCRWLRVGSRNRNTAGGVVA